MLYPNFREKIRNGIPVCGCTINVFAPEQVEQLGLLGFDFVFIDNEHGPFTDRELLTMITAGDAVGIPCLVRVYENGPAAIKHVMDCGAAGIIVPDCSTPQLARQAIDALKYAPVGNRGLSTTRSSYYGLREGLAEYVKKSNEESILVCQVESPEGVANAEALASIDEIDVLFIGTTDLSHAMGFTGQRTNEAVLAAVETVKAAAGKHGKALGAMVRADEGPQDYIDDGYVMPVASGASFFVGGAKKFLSTLRKEQI